jgi:ABC-2 type transport system permease protein
LAAEWSKLTSLRSTYITLLVTLVLAIGLSGAITLIIGSSINDWDPVARAGYDPIMMSFFGLVFSTILLTLIGVTFVASEYATGMIRLTLTTTPHRGRVLLAKVLIITALTLVVGLISSFGAFLVGQSILGSFDLRTASLSEPDALRTVLGFGLLAPMYPLLFRSTAAAISTVLALIFTPAIFGALLPAWWQENVLRYLPDRAADSISIGHLGSGGFGPSTSYLEPTTGAIVIGLWLAVFLGAATVTLLRRDV